MRCCYTGILAQAFDGVNPSHDLIDMVTEVRGLGTWDSPPGCDTDSDCGYNKAVEYEWDDAKNEVNIEKQGIGFEAVHGFEWDTAVVKPGDRRGEVRWAAVGYIAGRLHRVIYTERGSRRRIISLHKANARERRRYEQLH